MREDSIYQETKEVLHKSGWQDEDILLESVIHTHGRVYRPDIVLLYNLFPLAVAEIKRKLDVMTSITFNTREQAEALGIPFALVTDTMRTIVINTLTGESHTYIDFPTPKDLWTALGRKWNPNDPRLYSPFQLERRDFRLHQVIAVTRVIEAVMSGKNRILLNMAVGTGKTWVLFQIAWKLIKSGHSRRMLYLSDRVLLLEQTKERFRPLDQNLLVLSKTHPANDSAQVHMATISQVRSSETSRSLLSSPSDFYDLIFLESSRYERSLQPILEYFSMATRIALGDVVNFAIPPEYGPPIFTYTVNDAFETEYAQPPDGFIATRLGEIAEIHLGKRLKDIGQEINNTTTIPNRYLITPKNFLEDGILQLNAEYLIAEYDTDERFVLQSEDILLVRFTTGVQNRVALVPRDLPGVRIFDDSLIRIRVDRQRADPKAVFAFLRSDSGQRILRTMVAGAVVSKLSVQDVANMQVFLPTLAGMVNEVIELSAAMRALHEIKTRIIPLLERAEQEHGQNTESTEDASNLHAAAERLRNLSSTLVPPSLAERITSEYPTPIALAYRRFQDAQFDVYQQLLRLRDLFEAATYYIYYIILADMFRNLEPQKYFIEDRGARRAYNGYSMAGRIGFVSAVLQIASQDGGKDLFIPEVVEQAAALDLARHLQEDFRNRLSHTTTAHEGIAERTLKTFRPAVEQLLEQLEISTRYPLVRISSFVVRQGRWVRRMVVYKGVVPHSEEEHLSAQPIFPAAESDHLVLLGGEGKVLDLYPLYQLLTNEETRFETHLCVLKQRKQSERRLEGESIQGAFEIQLEGFDEFEKLRQKILESRN